MPPCPQPTRSAPGMSRPNEAVTLIRDVSLITIERRGAIGLPGIAGRVLLIVAQAGVPVLLFSQSSSEQSFCFAIPRSRTALVMQAMQTELQHELESRLVMSLQARSDIMLITTNGTSVQERAAEAARICRLLADEGINILVMAQGSSRYSMALVIEEAHMSRAFARWADSERTGDTSDNLDTPDESDAQSTGGAGSAGCPDAPGRSRLLQAIVIRAPSPRRSA
jgi:aspartokinase